MKYFSQLKRSIEVQRCSEHIVSTRAHYPRGTMLGTIDETYQKAWSLFPREVEIYDTCPGVLWYAHSSPFISASR